MPFTSIPVKADGEILTAGHLNLLSANQEFLYAQSRQTNNPFISYRTTTELLNQDDVYWTITHRLRYFHYKVNCQDGSNTTYLHIYYGATRVVEITGPTSGVTGYFDLNTISVTLGTRYQLIVDVFKDGHAAEITVDYLLESDSTSI